MNYLKKIILFLFFLFPISNSFAAMVNFIQKETFVDSNASVTGIEFNSDGTKLFTTYTSIPGDEDYHFVNEYNLSSPYDISTRTYAGDDERCSMGDGTDGTQHRMFDLEFSSDGMKLFTTVSDSGTNNAVNGDIVYRFDLTLPYDVSTCVYVNETVNLDDDDLQNESNAGNRSGNHKRNRSQGIEINEDGTKLFLIFHSTTGSQRLLEYKLTTPYDLDTIELVTTAGIALGSQGVSNAMGMRFSSNGKRIFVVSHTDNSEAVTQISLDVAYDTSSFTVDGSISVPSDVDSTLVEPRGIAFSGSGLKMYIGHDTTSHIYESNLVCPFNIISGKCPSITENSDRTGIAEAQIEVAKRTIDRSTDTVLNRLKWIRRNKDNQNLTKFNFDINFTNQKLASLTEAVKISAAKKKKKDGEKDVFYWSEGSIAAGKIGNTSISSIKKIGTDVITIGADKFTNNNGIKGLAFRVGKNNVDVGTVGSNLETETYNLTYYATSPVKDDTKFIDTVIGIGALRSDILSIIDGKRLSANRNGRQLYGTIKIKDEIKKNNLILIPSGQLDLGLTILGQYTESGVGAIEVEKQNVKTTNIRTAMGMYEDLSNENYTFKRHGKIEYVADISRSSNFKYSYVSDKSPQFHDRLNSGALHNLNGEIGIDIILPNSFSIFFIYERNEAIGLGHTNKIHIAIGYLPNKNINYAFSINGSENLISQFVMKKNINGYDLTFNLNDDLTNLGNNKEASINLNKVF